MIFRSMIDWNVRLFLVKSLFLILCGWSIGSSEVLLGMWWVNLEPYLFTSWVEMRVITFSLTDEKPSTTSSKPLFLLSHMNATEFQQVSSPLVRYINFVWLISMPQVQPTDVPSSLLFKTSDKKLTMNQSLNCIC